MKDYPWIRITFLVPARLPATPMKKVPFPWWIGDRVQIACTHEIRTEVCMLVYSTVEDKYEELRHINNIVSDYWGNTVDSRFLHVKGRYNTLVFTPQYPKPDWFETPKKKKRKETKEDKRRQKDILKRYGIGK